MVPKADRPARAYVWGPATVTRGEGCALMRFRTEKAKAVGEGESQQLLRPSWQRNAQRLRGDGPDDRSVRPHVRPKHCAGARHRRLEHTRQSPRISVAWPRFANHTLLFRSEALPADGDAARSPALTALLDFSSCENVRLLLSSSRRTDKTRFVNAASVDQYIYGCARSTGMAVIRSSLTMLGVSRAFLSTLLPALRGERHFALIENSPSSTQARV